MRTRLAIGAVLLAPILAAGPARCGAQATDGFDLSPAARQQGTDVLRWEARDRFDRVRFMNSSSSHYLTEGLSPGRGRILFLPPLAPALGLELPEITPVESGPPAAHELVPFVSEIFYPQLALKLAANELPEATRARLLEYRDRKFEEQARIRRAAVRAPGGSGAAGESRPGPSSAIRDLDAAAARLAAEMLPAAPSLLPPHFDPGAAYTWTVGPPEATPDDAAGLRREADHLRGCSYFIPVLSIDQRRLLLEAAADLEEAADAKLATLRIPPGLKTLGFSPEPARILVPENLPPGLGADTDAYLSAKKALKDQLRAAVSRYTLSVGHSSDELVLLARGEAPLIAACEEMADGLRGRLGRLTDPPSPGPTPLTSDLETRIAAYRRHKLETLRELRNLLAASPAAVPGAPDEAITANAWLHDGRSTAEIRASNLRVSVEQFDRLQTELIAALRTEESAIRESLATYIRGRRPSGDTKTVNDLLRDFEAAREREERRERYADYRSATFAPGLSRDERRILFDAAWENLGLPLPTGLSEP
jgi:hypothetical protein